jgi:hypothetical protein
MTHDTTAPKVERILAELHGKFGQNILLSAPICSEMLQTLEVKARATYQFGQLLGSSQLPTSFRRRIADILDEIFADTIISAYLASCALDNPAKILGRRVLELGLAVVYLWDQPAESYGWFSHDKDLNFQNMLSYMDSSAFKTFIGTECKCDLIFDAAGASHLYRELSNVVHGKMGTFESALPDRFVHSPTDWSKYLVLMNSVQRLLLHLWECRFPDEFEQLTKQLPILENMK